MNYHGSVECHGSSLSLPVSISACPSIPYEQADILTGLQETCMAPAIC
ncbi:unnamed protein product [Staurois parvus]|uniref:Uncharacterized protein n=1 Tax=Staurois parvus TaxID=386267 RepID=A0ABN9CZV2_9NEOB|nr:unnamed protein product [Staurois parvus]